MERRVKAGVNAVRGMWEYVFSPETRAELHEVLDFDESLIPDGNDPNKIKRGLKDAEVVLATWGAIPFTEDILSVCPGLKLVLYGAGSVKGLVTEAFAGSGAKICSAVHLNAVPVAEFTLGIILASMKDVFLFHNAFLARGRSAWKQPLVGYEGGYYKKKIGLIGFGEISKHLMKLLRNFDFDVYIRSNHITEQEEASYNVKRASLDFIMSTCDVVSIHCADVPKNWNLINRDNLKLMKRGARLINTARGRMINEEDLVEKLKEGEITAYLDVTHPEPPEEGHPFYWLENCVLTPHVSGSCGAEVHRMGEFVLREFLNWREGKPLTNEIDVSSLYDRA